MSSPILTESRWADLLLHTSRSFALGLEALREPLRSQLRAGYLLCRVFDTYEDSTWVDVPRRLMLIGHSRRWLAALSLQAGFSCSSEEWKKVHDFDRAWTDPRLSASERSLLENSFDLWAGIYELGTEERRVFSVSLQDMLLGMETEIQQRQKNRDPSVRTLEEVDRYCYGVAGTVGLLITGLFQLDFNRSGAISLDRNESIGFGKTLQLVNIIKDFHEDWREGRCFWPEIRMPQEPGLEPPPEFQQLEKSFQSLRGLFYHYAEQAGSYLSRLPRSRPDFIFAFEFPLKMAFATMELAGRDLGWLREGRGVKVSRADTLLLLSQVRGK